METKNTQEEILCTSFEPVGSPLPYTLILGSMPSVKSLQKHQYYGHPQNRFWSLIHRMDESTGSVLEVPYTTRLKILDRYRIALWDVASRCRRKGSLDKDMKDIEFNDIGRYVERHPTLRRILCNGSKAYHLLLALRSREAVFDTTLAERRISVYPLHSTSPIPTAKCRNPEDLWTLWDPMLTIIKNEIRDREVNHGK